jgi:rhodanese-related sulfurtransferase
MNMKPAPLRYFLSLATLLLMLFGAQPLQAADAVNVQQAQSLVSQGALLLDVREPDEYAGEHAPNAILIPLAQIGSRMQEIAAYKNKPVVVMFHSGRRSAQAAQLLQDGGFSQVSSVEGGIVAWKAAGLKLVTEPASGGAPK